LLLALGTLSVGYLVAFRMTFGYAHDPNDLWLALQCGTLVLFIFFTTLRLFQRQIEYMAR